MLNILPATIAEQLRDGATTIAQSQPDVSILFADIVGFTPLGDALGAHALVELLNEVFVAFDDLVEAAGLEKIKTIGDSYMVAGGLPDATPRSPRRPARVGDRDGRGDHAGEITGRRAAASAHRCGLRAEPVGLVRSSPQP